MIILGEGEKFYGTRWDHGDLDIHRFVTQWDDSQPVKEEAAPPEPEEMEEKDTPAEVEAVKEGKAAVGMETVKESEVRRSRRK